MTIRETIANLLTHFTPLTHIKQVFPVHMPSLVVPHFSHASKPWMNVDEVELTAEDFA
jgi:hypothetical protein